MFSLLCLDVMIVAMSRVACVTCVLRVWFTLRFSRSRGPPRVPGTSHRTSDGQRDVGGNKSNIVIDVSAHTISSQSPFKSKSTPWRARASKHSPSGTYQGGIISHTIPKGLEAPSPLQDLTNPNRVVGNRALKIKVWRCVHALKKVEKMIWFPRI